MKNLVFSSRFGHHDALSGKVVQGIVIGNRIPRDYFVTQGSGESDITVHAGSYHLALKDAGIERANIMTYSSILPTIAHKIEKPASIEHGAVMETIMAVANGKKGEELSAGIIYGWLYNRKNHELIGGLVCEHNGIYSQPEIRSNLSASLNELYVNGFETDFELKDIECYINSCQPKKKYGSALVALCFVNYYVPVLSNLS
jgi:arginine decarboxylase